MSWRQRTGAGLVHRHHQPSRVRAGLEAMQRRRGTEAGRRGGPARRDEPEEEHTAGRGWEAGGDEDQCPGRHASCPHLPLPLPWYLPPSTGRKMVAADWFLFFAHGAHGSRLSKIDLRVYLASRIYLIFLFRFSHKSNVHVLIIKKIVACHPLFLGCRFLAGSFCCEGCSQLKGHPCLI